MSKKTVEVITPNWLKSEPIAPKELQVLTAEHWKTPENLLGRRLVIAHFNTRSDEGIYFESCQVTFHRTMIIGIVDDGFDRWAAAAPHSSGRQVALHPGHPTAESIGFNCSIGNALEACWTSDHYAAQLDLVNQWAESSRRPPPGHGDGYNFIYSLL